MSEKKIVALDLTGCKYIFEFHERIRVAFDFPDFYGKNWDAFWDLLRSECDADSVEIIGEHTLPKDFDGQIKNLHEILQRNKEQLERYGKIFNFEVIS